MRSGRIPAGKSHPPTQRIQQNRRFTLLEVKAVSGDCGVEFSLGVSIELRAWTALRLLTEAATCGIPLPEAMQQSLHKSVPQVASFYKMGRAARLFV
jgi:hypothetical protein